MNSSKCLMFGVFCLFWCSCLPKMVKCRDAIHTVNSNEKEVRIKATVGKEQPWEYLGKQDFTHRGEPCSDHAHEQIIWFQNDLNKSKK